MGNCYAPDVRNTPCFEDAITREHARYLVSVRDFIRELEKLNHHFSPSQSNDWIKHYMPGWRG